MVIVDAVRKSIGIMLNPGKESKKKMSVAESLTLYYKMAIVPIILSIIFGFAASMVLGTHYKSLVTNDAAFGAIRGFSAAILISLFVFAILIEPICLLVSAFIVQLVGGPLLQTFKGTFENTYAAFIYAAMPLILFIFLAATLNPLAIFVYLILSVWSVVVLIIALANQQKISRLASLCILILSSIVSMILYMVIIFGFAAIVASSI